MKQFSLSDQCTLLRYDLSRNKKDVFGITHKYKTSPSDGNGGINFFDNDEDLQRWINQVKEMRSMNGDINLLDYLEEKNKNENFRLDISFRE